MKIAMAAGEPKLECSGMSDDTMMTAIMNGAEIDSKEGTHYKLFTHLNTCFSCENEQIVTNKIPEWIGQFILHPVGMNLSRKIQSITLS